MKKLGGIRMEYEEKSADEVPLFVCTPYTCFKVYFTQEAIDKFAEYEFYLEPAGFWSEYEDELDIHVFNADEEYAKDVIDLIRTAAIEKAIKKAKEIRLDVNDIDFDKVARAYQRAVERLERELKE
jgi:hypothetical protein